MIFTGKVNWRESLGRQGAQCGGHFLHRDQAGGDRRLKILGAFDSEPEDSVR